jgi:hypothetical protein
MTFAGASFVTLEASPDSPEFPTNCGELVVAIGGDPTGFDNAVLGGYSCLCNGRTVSQLNRTTHVDPPIQLGLT